MAVLLLPLVPLNVSEYQGWGGDWAMYILQARQLVEGFPFPEVGYIYSADHAKVGPPLYPVGFPLLLLGSYLANGVLIPGFAHVVGLTLVAAGVLLFLLLRKTLPLFLALPLSALVVANPWFLEAKLHILSDIPFCAALLLVLFLIQRGSAPILLSLALAFAVSIRSIGIVLFPALALSLVSFWNREPELRWRRGLAGIVGGGVLLVVVKAVGPHADGGAYLDQLTLSRLPRQMIRNALAYGEDFVSFFPGGQGFLSPGLLLAIPFLVALGWGLIQSLRKRQLDMPFWTLLGYGAAVLLWPTNQGLRMLFPLFVVSIILAARGLPRNSKGQWLALMFSACMLTSSALKIVEVVGREDVPPPGPYRVESQEMFDWVKHELPADARVDFFKPRVMVLFGERQSAEFSPRRRFPELDTSRPHYLVLRDRITRFRPQSTAQTVWENDGFFIYRLNEF